MVKESPAAYRITDLKETDRPRERLMELGAQSLSNAELLAILLRVGVQGENAVQVGQRLLVEFGGLHGLHKAALVDVKAQHGIGEAKACQIMAAIELGRRLVVEEQQERPTVSSPQDAANLTMYEMGALQQEELWVMLLDTRNHLISIEKIYKGSLNSSMVRVAELFKAAITRSAAGIIILHNHPSGDPTPSPEDIALTRNIIQSGKMLDIDILDHLVIGLGKYISLKDKGLGFS
jgi:DNA repair protein RadC